MQLCIGPILSWKYAKLSSKYEEKSTITCKAAFNSHVHILLAHLVRTEFVLRFLLQPLCHSQSLQRV